jgi:hypothetical protein
MSATPYRFLAPLLVLAGLSACNDSDPAGPASEPFTATNVAVLNWIDAAGRCAPELTLNIQGTGQSNLGAVTVQQSHCFNPSGPNPLAFHDGRFTNTFGDGSAFSGTYSGTTAPTANPAIFGINAQWEVTAGSGAFAGATGGGTATGQANVGSGDGSISLSGTITR